MAGIYIHVPFCTQRCIYCDFYSQTDMARQADYLRAVRRELEMRADELDGEPVETIYFGGGTPSQLCGKISEPSSEPLAGITPLRITARSPSRPTRTT